MNIFALLLFIPSLWALTITAQSKSTDVMIFGQPHITTIESVHDKMRRNQSIVLIDVREPKEWQTGKIPKAKLIPHGNIREGIIEMTPNKNAEIVLYCASGRRSLLAANTLSSMGYNNVKSMAGGIHAWRKAGYKIEK